MNRVKIDIYRSYKNYFGHPDPNLKLIESCIVARRFPWQKWRLETELGIGNMPGEIYDWSPVRMGSHSYASAEYVDTVVCQKIEHSEMPQKTIHEEATKHS